MDRETVERVARTAHIRLTEEELERRTAHIRLTEEELERYSGDLGDILGYFELLDEAPNCDSYGIDPIGVADVTRDDEPRMTIDADRLLRDMNTYERYVRGPRLS